jgi:hypothetical protein
MAARGIPAGFASELANVAADPAAGGEFQAVVPADTFWEVLAVTVQLVQGITQTPQPILVVDDGANELWSAFGSSGAQASSTTARYTWAAGGPAPGALVGSTPAIRANSHLPRDLTLKPGWRIGSSTPGIGANSDYGVARLVVVAYTYS